MTSKIQSNYYELNEYLVELKRNPIDMDELKNKYDSLCESFVEKQPSAEYYKAKRIVNMINAVYESFDRCKDSYTIENDDQNRVVILHFKAWGFDIYDCSDVTIISLP